MGQPCNVCVRQEPLRIVAYPSLARLEQHGSEMGKSANGSGAPWERVNGDRARERTVIVGISRRSILAMLSAVVGLPAQSLAAPSSLAFMHGVWVGGGMQLSLDTERMLANVDPAKPFQWDALVIRNISDGMVTFWIAESRFIGLFDSDHLSLARDTSHETIKMERRPR